MEGNDDDTLEPVGSWWSDYNDGEVDDVLQETQQSYWTGGAYEIVQQNDIGLLYSKTTLQIFLSESKDIILFLFSLWTYYTLFIIVLFRI